MVSVTAAPFGSLIRFEAVSRTGDKGTSDEQRFDFQSFTTVAEPTAWKGSFGELVFKVLP